MKETCGNRNRHDEIPDLMAEMHKFSDNKKCLGQCHDNEDAIQNMLGKKVGFKINDRNNQFKNGNTQQDPECSPDRFRIERVFLLCESASLG